MYLTSSNALFLATAFMVTANAAPQTGKQLSARQGSTIIPGDKMGAVTYLNTNQATMAVYQTADTSIYSLSGSGIPTQGSYTTDLVLTAGSARNDTPLALAVGIEGIIHMFYHGSAECPGGHVLTEAFYDDGSGTWKNGALTASGICASSDSNLLFALAPISGLATSDSGYDVFRVGYVQAGTDNLCDAWYKRLPSPVWSSSYY